jgi:hypothetical protein
MAFRQIRIPCPPALVVFDQCSRTLEEYIQGRWGQSITEDLPPLRMDAFPVRKGGWGDSLLKLDKSMAGLNPPAPFKKGVKKLIYCRIDSNTNFCFVGTQSQNYPHRIGHIPGFYFLVPRDRTHAPAAYSPC